MMDNFRREYPDLASKSNCSTLSASDRLTNSCLIFIAILSNRIYCGHLFIK